MSKIFTLICLLTLSSTAFGQILNEKEIYGKWKIEKILKKPTSPQFTPLLDGFENSTFFFNQNGNFELTTSSESELFEMMTEMTNGTKWKVEKNKSYVKIGSQEDGYSIMGISIKEINGKKTFNIDESEITLEMKKIE